ncbi:flavin reductase family protein [Achromobacter sp. LC458]|uniref:flavin reductase family protein n=1 Tax=unclassified Achromobacter TaxID=2626865 RepID=UPI00062A3AF3|nr:MULTISPECIES: flavin reductase family protein [unclassified Achromobacter]AYD65707.1 flavin reductase family protein [Achromobacter sp. B7]QYJ19846.1 flavin reductase family protein [Achromobacter sp. ES-001]TRM49403.1 flavin reductase family protein [Achromobacter sp. LC458]HCQ46768.1 flavin reductase family protein [Achromobacter sp.]
MQIYLSNAGAITLRHPSDFRRLDVLADPQPRDRLEHAIARVGRREDERHVRLSPSVLRFLSQHAGDPKWEADFSAMVDYAARHGWVDERGDIRAHMVVNEHDQVVSVDDFKAAMRSLPAGISAVTTGQGDQVAGMIVSSLTSISADPPMVGFFVQQTSSAREPLLRHGRFVANVLGEGHEAVMQAFLGQPQGMARFAQGGWVMNEQGTPVLPDALASIECDIVCTEVLGTHDLIVGKIRKTTCREAQPVINFKSATHRIAPVRLQ